MPVQSNTPLSYLMDMLYIQGTQLAKLVHVDRTVISRWKNGRTDLSMKSAYFDDIVNAILDVNEQRGLGTLERFFSSITKKSVSKRKDLHKLVSSWLVSKEFERQFHDADTGDLYSASYKIYRGLSGKQDAVSYMLDVLESSDEKHTVLCYDTSYEINYNASRQNSLHFERVVDAFAKLGEVCMIFFINRPSDQIFNMFKSWMPLFLMRHAKMFYTHDTEPPFYNYVHSIRGKLALVGVSHEHERQNQYTAAYEDPITIGQIEASLDNMTNRLPILFRKFETRDICLDMQDAEMSALLDKSSGQYIIHHGLPLIPFSVDILETVINNMQLEFSEERRLQMFTQNCAVQMRRILSGNVFNRIVVSLNSLLLLATEEKVYLSSLSSLLERDVWLESRFILNILLDMLEDSGNDPNMELALSPPGFEVFLNNTELWVKNHSFAYLTGSYDASLRIFSSEFVTVNAFYMAAEKYWQRLPLECKQRKWIREQLAELR